MIGLKKKKEMAHHQGVVPNNEDLLTIRREMNPSHIFLVKFQEVRLANPWEKGGEADAYSVLDPQDQFGY